MLYQQNDIWMLPKCDKLLSTHIKKETLLLDVSPSSSGHQAILLTQHNGFAVGPPTTYTHAPGGVVVRIGPIIIAFLS